MKRIRGIFWYFAFCFVLLIFGANTAVAERFSASEDFFYVQGHRGWYYLDSLGHQLVWDAGHQWWYSPNEPYRLLWSWGGHPGDVVGVARRWVAPQNGNARITGVVRDDNPGGGDGVLVAISKNGIVLWQQTIPNGSVSDIPFSLTTGVVTGDAIDFVIHPNANNWWDATLFSPVIEFTAGETIAERFSASGDFSSVQGHRGWYYLDSAGNQMFYDFSNGRWRGNEQYLLLWNNGGHPGEKADAVRRWTAPQAGSVRIGGTAKDNYSGCGTDGVVVSIRKGSSVLWRQTVARDDAVGVNFDVESGVNAGDTIDFVINKGIDAVCDVTGFDPVIEFTSASVYSELKYIIFNFGMGRQPLDEELHEIAEFGGNTGIRLGFSTDTSEEFTMLGNLNAVEEHIDSLFATARRTGLAVQINLWDVTWWGNRPDLWNFFDPTKPGYNPLNIFNVEWSCFDPSCASQNSWRNWGFGFWTGAPAPNISSTVIRTELEERYRVIAAVLKRNIDALQKDGLGDLFAGVKIGWEAAVGGNTAVDQERLDRQETGWGYRAYMDYRCPVENPICINGIDVKPADFNDVMVQAVHDYLELIARVLFDGGIPRERIWAHALPVWENGALNYVPAAFNAYSRPAWSMYPFYSGPYDMMNPAETEKQALQEHGFPAWGVGESNVFSGEYGDWFSFFNRVLNNPNVPNGKMIALYNWGDPYVGSLGFRNALRDFLAHTQ